MIFFSFHHFEFWLYRRKKRPLWNLKMLNLTTIFFIFCERWKTIFKKSRRSQITSAIYSSPSYFLCLTTLFNDSLFKRVLFTWNKIWDSKVRSPEQNDKRKAPFLKLQLEFPLKLHHHRQKLFLAFLGLNWNSFM